MSAINNVIYNKNNYNILSKRNKRKHPINVKTNPIPSNFVFNNKTNTIASSYFNMNQLTKFSKFNKQCKQSINKLISDIKKNYYTLSTIHNNNLSKDSNYSLSINTGQIDFLQKRKHGASIDYASFENKKENLLKIRVNRIKKNLGGISTSSNVKNSANKENNNHSKLRTKSKNSKKNFQLKQNININRKIPMKSKLKMFQTYKRDNGLSLSFACNDNNSQRNMNKESNLLIKLYEDNSCIDNINGKTYLKNFNKNTNKKIYINSLVSHLRHNTSSTNKFIIEELLNHKKHKSEITSYQNIPEASTNQKSANKYKSKKNDYISEFKNKENRSPNQILNQNNLQQKIYHVKNHSISENITYQKLIVSKNRNSINIKDHLVKGIPIPKAKKKSLINGKIQLQKIIKEIKISNNNTAQNIVISPYQQDGKEKKQSNNNREKSNPKQNNKTKEKGVKVIKANLISELKREDNKEIKEKEDNKNQRINMSNYFTIYKIDNEKNDNNLDLIIKGKENLNSKIINNKNIQLNHPILKYNHVKTLMEKNRGINSLNPNISSNTNTIINTNLNKFKINKVKKNNYCLNISKPNNQTSSVLEAFKMEENSKSNSKKTKNKIISKVNNKSNINKNVEVFSLNKTSEEENTNNKKHKNHEKINSQIIHTDEGNLKLDLDSDSDTNEVIKTNICTSEKKNCINIIENSLFDDTNLSALPDDFDDKFDDLYSIVNKMTFSTVLIGNEGMFTADNKLYREYAEKFIRNYNKTFSNSSQKNVRKKKSLLEKNIGTCSTKVNSSSYKKKIITNLYGDFPNIKEFNVCG